MTPVERYVSLWVALSLVALADRTRHRFAESTSLVPTLRSDGNSRVAVSRVDVRAI